MNLATVYNKLVKKIKSNSVKSQSDKSVAEEGR